MEVTKADIRRYLVMYHHLTDDGGLSGDEQILNYIDKVGCIQYDPLDVVGRNPDLVLQSRCKGYRKGDINRLLYEERKLFDVWDKCMSICPVSHWPYFSRFRKRMMTKRFKDVQDAVMEITEYLQHHPYACSSDFRMEERIGWHYGPQRMAKAALEFMCYAGMAVVHHKNGTRRYYCLAGDFIPEKYLSMPDANKTQADYDKWQVLRRIRSIGILWNRGGDAWLGLQDFKSSNRNSGFSLLLKEGLIQELKVTGMVHPVYIATADIPRLKAACGAKDRSSSCRIIAPLDNFIWDRALIKELFGFDYRWEVYVPEEKRRYGYYVLPVLYGSQFIGRIKLRTDKAEKRLVVEAFWWEDGIRPLKKYKNALNSCLKHFQTYNLCTSVHFECEIGLPGSQSRL